MTSDSEEDPDKQSVLDQMKKVKEDDGDSRTLRLWKQYVQMVEILCLYIYSERSGNLELQKYCIRLMIPIFHASGHLPYAKAARLFHQQLEELKNTLDEKTYRDFINGFTIEGNFTDQEKVDETNENIWLINSWSQYIRECISTMGTCITSVNHHLSIPRRTHWSLHLIF